MRLRQSLSLFILVLAFETVDQNFKCDHLNKVIKIYFMQFSFTLYLADIYG